MKKKGKKIVKKTKKIMKKAVKRQTKKVVKQLINKKMLIGEVAEKYPAVAGVLFEYGMHCIGCQINAYETIEQGCLGHGMNEKQIGKVIEKMNKIANKKK